MGAIATVKQDYRERIVPALKKEFDYSSVMQVPVLKKIVINQGLGMATADKKIIEAITKSQLRTDIPEFKAGDTVRVHVRIVEGGRERIQQFEGVVIKRRGGGISATYTVRKISNGVGVERTFPVHTPKVEKIEVVRKGRVRRAKLYYLRNLRGKAARIREVR